jgi:hypothetical protein
VVARFAHGDMVITGCGRGDCCGGGDREFSLVP